MVSSIDQYYKEVASSVTAAIAWFETTGLNEAVIEDHAVFKVGKGMLTFSDKREIDRLGTKLKLVKEEHVVHYLHMTKKNGDEARNFSYVGFTRGVNQLHEEGVLMNQEGGIKYFPTDGIVTLDSGEEIVLSRETSGKYVCDKLEELASLRVLNSGWFTLPQKYGEDKELLPIATGKIRIPPYVTTAVSLLSKVNEDLPFMESTGDVMRADYSGVVVMPVRWLYRLLQDMLVIINNRKG